MKISLFRCFAVCTALLFIISCQKEVSGDDINGATPITPPDLSTKINSSVSGFVVDQNNQPLQNAQVKAGTVTTTTDEFGFFQIRNVQVVKNAATVTITKAGYFTGTKTYTAVTNKAAFFRVKLIPLTNSGTIDAAAGGSVALPNGFRITLPANAVINATTQTAYTGMVTVNSNWIDPTGSSIAAIMPGDLRGVDTSGSIRFLASFGMASVELTGGSGERLQIATGKKASLVFPIPSSLLGKAPATIPLWYFDENTGLWKEEGSAVKSGNTYTGDVKHFTVWNVDDPEAFVQYSCTIVNGSGQPVPYAYVKVTDGYFYSYSYTDSTGFTSGYAPKNAQLTLQVFDNSDCSAPVFSYPFTTGTANVALGTLTIPPSNAQVAIISGKVKGCNNAVVSNGVIMVKQGNHITRYPLHSDGTYSISKVFCSLPVTLTLIGIDYGNAQQSNEINFSVTNAGQNNVADILACGQTTAEYFIFTDNGSPHSYSAPVDSLYWIGTPAPTNTASVYARTLPLTPNNYAMFTMANNNVTVGSTQVLSAFSTNSSGNFMFVNGSVNITEYGAIGQFVAGTFTAVKNDLSTGTQHSFAGSFRVRRAN